MPENNILKLTLRKEPFDIMFTGEKTEEFRKPSKWIKSRLIKSYEKVRFTNGYHLDSPWFECEYKGFYIAENFSKRGPYSNGLIIAINKGDIVINLGRILSFGKSNLNKIKVKTNKIKKLENLPPENNQGFME